MHCFGYLIKTTTWKSSTGRTEHTSTQYFCHLFCFSAAILPIHSNDMQPSKCIYNIVRTLWFSWASWTTKTIITVLNKSVQIERQQNRIITLIVTLHISYLRKVNLLIKQKFALHLRVAVLEWLNRCFESARPSSSRRWCHNKTFRH